jgi:hypothetical protein
MVWRRQRGPATDRWALATMLGCKFPVRSETGQTHLNLDFKLVQTLIDPKNGLLELQKFEIKYGCEDLEKMNNFLPRNFCRFERYFE